MNRQRTPQKNRFSAHAGRLSVLVAALGLLAPGMSQADDTVLFSAAVAPNVLLHVDNSGSMNHIVWHEAYDPSQAVSCTRYSNTGSYSVSSDTVINNGGTAGCNSGNQTVYEDPAIPNNTRYTGHYLNWYFSPVSVPFHAEIAQMNNGTRSSCLGGGSFSLYRRSRVTAAKQILSDVICQVNQNGEVRFGLSKYRLGSDPRGGYVRVGVDDYSPAHGTALANAIDELEGETWTPLGESVYQIYSYFLSRDTGDIPNGQNGTTAFRPYSFDTSGAKVAPSSSTVPDDPVQYSCQKNFVIVITDGEPTRDDFDNGGGGGTDWGFERFMQVIGDYNPDGENEVPGGCSECAFYLDDIAKWMQENDMRPDLDGDQVIDTYTVGFTTNAAANALLAKTAQNGNGLFFQSNNAEELTDAIVESVTDIIQKSQSFTAATVPASRTTDGNDIFFSSFVPSDDAGFWEGHLKNYEFTLDGRILDANGDCALDDLSGDCLFGTLLPTAPPIFDAADEIGDPATRNLMVSLGGALTTFGTGLSAADLNVVDDEMDGPADEIALYSESNATTLEELTDEIIEYFTGCAFGTTPCVARRDLAPPEPMLGDIYHANPVVIAPPNAAISEQSYIDFATKYQERTKVIYGGSNDGFLHAFQAGAWNGVSNSFDRGTGEEIFGFMPYQARLNMQLQPLDNAPRDVYFVDGSPQAADVWIPSTTLDTTKEVDEWHTVMVGGMRQGGTQYYALDITNPDGEAGGPAYPTYLWEFPSENVAHPNAAEAPWMGETWSEPILTRVKIGVPSGPSTTQVVERWVAIFGAGFSEEGDPNDDANYDPNSLRGRALYIVDIGTGEVIAAKRFDPLSTGVEADLDYAFPSAPSVFDLDRNGDADVVYIGDLGGQVFRWVLQGTDPSAWEIEKVLQADPFDYTVAGVPETYYKSFFFPPTGLVRNGVLWLGMGTGERHQLKFEGVDIDGDGDPDVEDGDNNRFYVFSDLTPEQVGADPALPLSEADLLDATDADCDTPIDRGYYVVADHAEKFVTSSVVFLGTLFTGSFVPIDSTDPCVAGGLAYLWVFRFSCGEGDGTGPTENEKRKTELGTGLPTSPRISVGNTGEEEDDDCEEMKVVVITSEGQVATDCAGKRPNSGTYLREWRQD